MIRRIRAKWYVSLVITGLLLLALALSACGGGDDATATPGESASSTATASNDGEATEESGDSDEPTTTLERLADILENPFLDTVTFGDAGLENYSAEFTGDFYTQIAGSQPIDLMVEQSSVDNYHLVVSGFGLDEQAEVWVVDGSTHVAGPGGLTFELPSIADSVIGSPSDYLIQVPEINTISGATEVGTEEIDGRSTTHYEVDPSEISEFTDGSEFNDATGTIDIWIDDELSIVIKMDVDVEWTDQNSDQQRVDYLYTLSNIGSTPDVQAP